MFRNNELFLSVVKKDATFLEELNVHTNYINENQILSHFFSGRYTEDELLNFIDEVRSLYYRFNKERRELYNFSITYNDDYATTNNKCFSTVINLCNLLKQTLKGTMKIFKNFCYSKKHKLIYKNGKSQRLHVHTHSNLGAYYTQLIIPFSEDEAIPKPLKELANLLLEFFIGFKDIIGICKEVLKEEAKILSDYIRLQKIYYNTIKKFYDFGKFTSNMINCPDSIDKVEDPMTREMLQTETDKWNEILAKYFHKRTPSELLMHYLLFTKFKEKYGFIPTDEETRLWNGNNDKIKKVRMLISFVDNWKESKGLQDRTKGNIKLSGKFLAKIMHWAINGFNIRKKDFVEYFNKTYVGKYQKIEYATVVAVSLPAEEKKRCIIEFENFLNQQKEKQKITA